MNGSDDRTQNTTAQPPETPMAQPPAAQAPPREAPAGPPYYGAPQPPPQVVPSARDPRAKSPALAGFLSVMPGLGQVYTGYYTRGFVHAIVVASTISILVFLADNRGDAAVFPLLSLFLAFFWFYNIIDATRRASLYNLYLEGKQEIEPPQDIKFSGVGGSLFGGLILIVVGFILLLSTRFDMSLDWIEEWWPLAPILLGLYLFGKAIQERLAGSAD